MLVLCDAVGAEIPSGSTTQTVSAGLTWQECQFPTPTFTAVYCGSLHLDQEAQVPVVLIRHSLLTHDLQPLLYVTGGPAAATIPPNGKIESWIQWLHDLNLDQDLVLFDFLGTGDSNPAYTCPAFAEAGPQVLAASLSADQEAEVYDQIAKNCYQELTAKNIDLSKLTLPYSVKHVSQLLKALPGVNWDIYGVSYGTRVVLQVMRQPPPNVRAVVLDSVLPPDVDVYHLQPRILKDALHGLFASCNYDEACKRQFPNLESEFYALIKKLDSQPLHYDVTDVDSGRTVPVMINGQRLLTLVYFSMYRRDFIERLPSALWAARDGYPEPLQPMAENLSYRYMENARTFNEVVFISAGCAERRPNITKEIMRKEASLYPQLQEHLNPTWKYDVCEYWIVPSTSDTYFEPIQSPIPTLLLAGELDPATPSIWAKHAHTTLQNSFLLIVPAVGHHVLNSNGCAIVATQTFLRQREKYTGAPCERNLRGPKFVTAFKPANESRHEQTPK